MSHEPSPTRLRLDALLDQKIPGGCNDCDAYQTMAQAYGFYTLSVHHDDRCATLAKQVRSKRGITP